jgi:hypothetical protein
MVDVAQLVEPRIVIPAVAGSSPVVHPTFPVVGSLSVKVWLIGPLAQLVEQLTLNQLVVGSIPTRPTISASAVKNLRGISLSLDCDVVPLSALCPIANRNPYALSIRSCHRRVERR